MEQAVQDQLTTIKDAIVAAIPVEQIYLFGSYAYGTPRVDSDLDIYVVMKDDAPYDAIEAEHIIRDAIHGRKTMPADILVKKKSRFQHRITAPTLEQEIAEKGLLVYG